MADIAAPLDCLASELGLGLRPATGRPSPIELWRRPAEARSWLDTAREACLAPPAEAEKAAEWILDNDYQINRALREIVQDLPANFHDKLPIAELGGDVAPRIYLIAGAILRANHLQLSLGSTVRFIQQVQTGSPLTIAELWAFPTMLRIVAIETLMAAVDTVFAGEVPPPFRLGVHAVDPASLDASERIARCISLLRIAAEISWNEFFDQASLTEQILQTDPSRAYAQMDFETRDSYRKVVEQIGAICGKDEREIAKAAVALAADSTNCVERHVGYWLVDRGRSSLEALLDARPAFSARLVRGIYAHPWALYSAFGFTAWCTAMLLPAAYLHASDAAAWAWVAGLALACIPASILAMVAVNWTLTRVLEPKTLPKLDFTSGLPCEAMTALVVPVVFPREEDIAPVVARLEAHWLANADPRLVVCLLADHSDADAGVLTQDETIVAVLRGAIETLNARYAANGHAPFHLLMRPRRLNPAQGVWMAWERKRGKLEEFNRMVLSGDGTAFTTCVGDGAALSGVRYVITVDADTFLPDGSVAKLVGTIAHPLNRPQWDAGTGRLERGHAVVQPRVEISPSSGERTLFARLFTGDTAIDIYGRAVSDVYQDLFGTGTFVGKGIYDVHAFQACLDGRVPENAILSHDLFEGAHCRAALATDIVLYETFPATYPEYSRRLHRWIRGDWQLLPWLGWRVPAVGSNRIASPFSAIDRWKMLDNLRRSLVAPSLVVLAVTGWLMLPGSPWFWTAIVILAQAGQLAIELLGGLAQGRRKGSVLSFWAKMKDHAGRAMLASVFLLHEALVSLHAISVTLWRLGVSRRYLLEWTTAAGVARRMRGTSPRRVIWLEMGPSSAAALVMATTVLILRPAAAIPAMLLLIPWALAPEIALALTRIRQPREKALGPQDTVFLRMLARRTWYYFETFAGPGDNWLPPDNYQGAPHEEIAHRTSPTNIGMLLLSSAAAWDLGFLGRAELAARSGNLLDALDRLDTYHGHLYNWYDTRSLEPLEPRYVSTVDSGNLAGALLAFAGSLRDAAAAPDEIEPQRWEGLCDLLDLSADAASQLDDSDAIAEALAALRGRIRRDDPKGGRDIAVLRAASEAEIAMLEQETARLAGSVKSRSEENLQNLHSWVERIKHHIHEMLRDAQSPSFDSEALVLIAERYEQLAWRMDFGWLYDTDRHLLVLGHNVSTSRTDPHFYDLLASEARLASYFAIAKRDVPVKHWFQLGRPVTKLAGRLTLVSWNGSMFEYLMPRLLLETAPNTLLGESERVAVDFQRQYGSSKGVPWGISESAYAARDVQHRFQYRAFGVPQLGLRRGLAQDLVVAPYASALALGIVPSAAAENLRRLDAMGAGGRFGLWEAIDFTPERTRPGEKFSGVNAYMAHHQGMIISAIANLLTGNLLARRFLREPRIGLASLLLSERVPDELPAELERLDIIEPTARHSVPAATVPSWQPARGPFPHVLLLGNGSLSSSISEAGGGGLRWHGHALTRFVADATTDSQGSWLYVHDQESYRLWSATRQPTGAEADQYAVSFEPHRAEFHRRDNGIDLRTEIWVAGSDDMEVRRLTIANESDQTRRLTLTSYAEPVLAAPQGDERHPAFSKLFVGAEFRRECGGLLFLRRARSPSETPPALLFAVIDENGPLKDLRYEVDRAIFIGRNRSLRNPDGARQRLTNSAGHTLDPVAALQFDCVLKPGERREFCMLTVAGGSASSVEAVSDRFTSLGAIDWTMGRSSDAALLALARVGIPHSEAGNLHTLASLMIYPHPALQHKSVFEPLKGASQADLWGLGISGDLPVLLLKAGPDGPNLFDLLARAHQWWRHLGLQTDLVIMQTSGSAYIEPLRSELDAILRDIGADHALGRSGGIHLLFSDQIGAERLRMLEATASVVLEEVKGSLSDQLTQALPRGQLPIPAIIASHPMHSYAAEETGPDVGMVLDNGLGAFSPDGKEYVINLSGGQTTPAPWANVLANDQFGTLVTESGGGFTWAVNSGEHRLTRWSNDPVVDPLSEALYLRDEETTAVWSIAPAPCHDKTDCQIRHGQGYSLWRRSSHGIEQEMLVLVPPEAPVKLVKIRLHNTGDRARRLTATYYAEWLLGAQPSSERRHVQCEHAPEAEALLARNCWNADFADRVAFLTSSRAIHSFTTDREEFLGREGDPAMPAGMARWGLSGEASSVGDCCAAYQVHLDLAPGEWSETVFALGEGTDREEAIALATEWREPKKAQAAMRDLETGWTQLCEAVSVQTPDKGFDLLVNRWLPYQTLSSRVFGRTGFYQASGAFGFRDQLQDVLALLHARPELARAHILECAAHQFEEGDVLHWWHPPSGRGVRTRFSDDLHWLPYAVGTYVEATGDTGILREEVDFLTAAPLAAHESDRFDRFERAGRPAPLIDHCERALERLATGANDLPLMGAGDWNDGMDRVGIGGRGESVWLAWFASVAIELHSSMLERVDRPDAARYWRQRAQTLRAAAVDRGWDGEWFRRAYDDRGNPLGSATQSECKIDSIAQSWAQFAGGDNLRSSRALASAWEHLVDKDAKLVRLLWPPFGTGLHDPGYIRAYPPGVRENGGQYNHAAAWLGLAFAAAGDGTRAYDIFKMISPVHRTATMQDVDLYRIEPYVVAGDICTEGANRGRGGWSWYTGAAGWTWRLAVEGILGLRLRAGRIQLAPILPDGWPGYSARLVRGGGTIDLTVEAHEGLARTELEMDGIIIEGCELSYPEPGERVTVICRTPKILAPGTKRPDGP